MCFRYILGTPGSGSESAVATTEGSDRVLKVLAQVRCLFKDAQGPSTNTMRTFRGIGNWAKESLLGTWTLWETE